MGDAGGECAASQPCGAGQQCRDPNLGVNNFLCTCYMDPDDPNNAASPQLRPETMTEGGPAVCTQEDAFNALPVVAGIVGGLLGCCVLLCLYLWMQRRWQGRTGAATYGADEKDAEAWMTAHARNLIAPLHTGGAEVLQTFTVSRNVSTEFEGGRYVNKKCDLTLFRVKKDSPFGRAGLEPGMRILKVNDTAVASKRALKRACTGLAHFRVTVMLPVRDARWQETICIEDDDAPDAGAGRKRKATRTRQPSEAACPGTPASDDAAEALQKECDELRAFVRDLEGRAAKLPLGGGLDADGEGADPVRRPGCTPREAIEAMLRGEGDDGGGSGGSTPPLLAADAGAEEESELRRQALSLFFGAQDGGHAPAEVPAEARDNGVDAPFKAKGRSPAGGPRRSVEADGAPPPLPSLPRPPADRGSLMQFLDGLPPGGAAPAPPAPAVVRRPPAPARRPPHDIAGYASELIEQQHEELDKMLAGLKGDGPALPCRQPRGRSPGLLSAEPSGLSPNRHLAAGTRNPQVRSPTAAGLAPQDGPDAAGTTTAAQRADYTLEKRAFLAEIGDEALREADSGVDEWWVADSDPAPPPRISIHLRDDRAPLPGPLPARAGFASELLRQAVVASPRPGPAARLLPARPHARHPALGAGTLL